MTLSNSVYGALKRKGLHNWGFLNIRQSDFDFNDLDLDALDLLDTDLFVFDDDE